MAITYSSPNITVTAKVSGTSTAGSATTLTDTSKTWTTNEHAGAYVVLPISTGVNALGYILSNTATVITIHIQFLQIDIANKTLSAFTPSSGQTYYIGNTLLDVYNADVAGGWGKITKLGNNSFFSTAKIILSTNGILGNVNSSIEFSSALSYIEITINSSGILIGGRCNTNDQGGIFTFDRVADSVTDNQGVVYPNSGGYWYNFGDTIYRLVSGVLPVAPQSGSYFCCVGGHGTSVTFEKFQIRNRTQRTYLDGLALIGSETSTTNGSNFVLLEDYDYTNRITVRGTKVGMSSSTTLSPTVFKPFRNAVLRDQTNCNIQIYGGHTIKIVDPDWDEDVYWLNSANAWTGYLYWQSSFNIQIQDSSEANLENVRVALFNSATGAEIFNVLTASTGSIEEQIVTHKYWAKSTYSVNPTITTYGYKEKQRLYGYKFAEFSKSAITTVKDKQQLVANPYTVSSYVTAWALTGIAINGSEKTITVSGTCTKQEVYDHSQAWGIQSGNIQYDEPLLTPDQLNTGWTVIVTGTLTGTGTYSTTPTVSSGGFFEDAGGAIWNDGGTLKYITSISGSIVDVGTSVGIENSVFAYGNEAVGLMTYDTSLNLTRLVADVDGEFEGYLEWKRDSTVHASCYSVAGYYGYQGAKVPRTLNGTPIVGEVTRLSEDTEVTNTRTDAGAVSGITFSATGVDIGDNTLADVYDHQQYKFWATTGYMYGTMLGCMEWCLNGMYITKAGIGYTGRGTSTVYQNMGGGGSFSSGTVEVELADNPAWTFGTMTVDFTEVGSYNYGGETFIGTIDFHNSSGGAVTVEVPAGVDYTTSGSPLPTIIEPQVYQSVTVSGAVAGSRIQIYDTTHSTQLYEGTPAFPYTWTDSNPYASDRTIRVRVMYKNGATAKMWWENVVGVATLANPAISAFVSQQDDTVYNTNAIDGSTITGVAIVDGTLRVNVSTGTMTWQKLYAYETDWLFTSAGIIDEGRFTVAKDVANYLWYDFKIKNVTSPTVPLVVSGGYGVDGDTGASIDMIDTTGGTIIFAPDHVVSSVVTVTGGNVITGDIADIPTAVWSDTTTYADGTKGAMADTVEDIFVK